MDFSQYEAIGIVVIGFGAIIVAGRPIVSASNLLTSLSTVVDAIKETVAEIKDMLALTNEKNERDHNILFEQHRLLDIRLTTLETEHKHEHGKKGV